MEQALTGWVEGIRAKGRIAKGDVAALRRQWRPDGLLGRADAQALIEADRLAGFAHSSWTPALTALLADYAVWGERPTGIIDEAMGRFLAEGLLGGDASPRAARVLAEIVREADQVDPALLARIEGEAAEAMPLAA